MLGNEILIIENLTDLEKLIGEKDFDVIALPAKINAEAASVRVMEMVGKLSTYSLQNML